MNAIDTNVLVYRLDRTDPVKRAKARSLLQLLWAGQLQTVLPWQVIGELVRYLRRQQDKGLIKRAALIRYVTFVRNSFQIVMPTLNVLDRALDLSSRYSLSHWDSMLLGACIEAGVTTLYTEDMGAPTAYDTVQLVNPFI